MNGIMMENVFGVDVAKHGIAVVGPNVHESVGNADLHAFSEKLCAKGNGLHPMREVTRKQR